jgi:hypothetical protein
MVIVLGNIVFESKCNIDDFELKNKNIFIFFGLYTFLLSDISS